MIFGLLAALALLVASVPFAGAKAGKGPNHEFDLVFSTKKTGKPTNFKRVLTHRYNYVAPAPGQQANPVTDIVITLPKGTKLDTSVVKDADKCNATKLQGGGPPACKKASIGNGEAEAVTGIAAVDPVKENAELFVVKGGILIYITPQGGVGQTASIPMKIRKNKLVVDVPPLCLPPADATPDVCENGEAVLTKLTTNIKNKSVGRGAKRKHLITTPKKCKTGKWTTSIKYTYSTGAKETVKSTSPCKKPAARRKSGTRR